MKFNRIQYLYDRVNLGLKIIIASKNYEYIDGL